MRDAGVLVLAGDLEGEPRAYGVQRVSERDRGDPRGRARHKLVAVLN